MGGPAGPPFSFWWVQAQPPGARDFRAPAAPTAPWDHGENGAYWEDGAAMDLSERVRHLIEPAVGGMGFDVVRVLVSGSRKPSLQAMVERRDGRAVSVDDCARISRAISALLDVEEPIKGAYTLEVSSPGIDRPLVKLGDFERFRGFQAKVEIARPVDGRRRFKGRLLGVEDDNIRIEIEQGEVKLPYPDIQRAKLVLTDDLIAASEEKKRA